MGNSPLAPLVLLGTVSLSMIARRLSSTLSARKELAGYAGAGKDQVGKPVYRITLDNGQMRVVVLTRGCAITSVLLLEPTPVDIVMGYESLQQYEAGKQNFGTVVGRCANRIKQGKFVLDGKEYQLPTNNGVNHLHGGPEGYFSRVFDVESCGVVGECAQAVFAYHSPDGEQGYPGSLRVQVKFELNKSNQLRMVFSAVLLDSKKEEKEENFESPQATIVNLCNHAYWNLEGHASGSVLGHELTLNSQAYTPVDDTLAITGETKSVEGTPFDFRTPTLLGKRLEETGGKGYDLNYVLHNRSLCSESERGEEENNNNNKLEWAATLRCNDRQMTVHTNAPGLQLYTGNFIDKKDDKVWQGKGTRWDRFGAVCLESQNWPDAVNHAHFPSPVLRAGQRYEHEVVHSFTFPRP